MQFCSWPCSALLRTRPAPQPLLPLFLLGKLHSSVQAGLGPPPLPPAVLPGLLGWVKWPTCTHGTCASPHHHTYHILFVILDFLFVSVSTISGSFSREGRDCTAFILWSPASWYSHRSCPGSVHWMGTFLCRQLFWPSASSHLDHIGDWLKLLSYCRRHTTSCFSPTAWYAIGTK